MEDESECHSNLNFHSGEETRDELESQTHVPLRQCDVAAGSEEIDFSFVFKSDSLTLLSVYRYARKIKSFLGWEDPTHEFESNEDQNSSDENLSSGEEPFLSNGEVSCQAKETNYAKDLNNAAFLDGREDVSCDKKKRNSSALEDIAESISPKDYLIASRDNSDLKKDSNSNVENIDNIIPQQIFRSEVSINVEDYCNLVTSPISTNKINRALENRSSSQKRAMDESLVQETVRTDSGLTLNSVDSILKDELGSVPSAADDIEFLDDRDGSVESKENTYEADIGYSSFQEDETDKSKCESILKDSISEKDIDEFIENGLQESFHGEVDNRIEQDNSSHNLGDEKGEENKEIEKSELVISNAYNSKELKKSVDDKSMENLVKQKQVNNIVSSKTDRTLKAHIQYENEITNELVSKDGISGKNYELKRKENPSADTECGFGMFRPQWLQPFATVKVYVILYSIIGILHGSYYSYLIGTLSTLEKRYAFKSKVSGAIMVADEATPLLLGVIIGYYAGKANRPRMIALGMLSSAACCFCSCLPYFIYGAAHYTTIHALQNDIGPKFCSSDSGKESCDAEDRAQTIPAVLFLVFGSFLKGFGNIAYYAVGIAYLDDNSEKKTTPIFLAITLALRLLGPLIGFLMSSVFLKLYENPAGDPGYGPDDPRWVGAWWIGFFLQGVLLVIFTLPIALFPRRLPNQKRMQKAITTSKESESLKEMFLGLFAALKRLGTNPVFVLLIINTNMKVFGHFGHSIMLPKYMENQFRLSASQASLYSGATSITFIMLSTIFGGYLIWKFRPRIKLLLTGMIISEIILVIGFLILIIPRCQTVDMVNFGMNDDGLILSGNCNQLCDCSTTYYTPFCGPNGTTYFSPCYAGCTQSIVSPTTSKKNKEFGNCSCASTTNDQNTFPTISEGVCPDEDCWSQALAYLIIYFILVTVSNTFTVAHSMILLRSIHPKDKSMALGTFETFICLFGFIPFPVTFGALVDSACLVWEKSCGETGNCWFYDMRKYAYLLHGVGALFCSFSVVCLISLYFLSSRIRDLYADEDEEKEFVDIKLDTISGSVSKL